MLLQLGLDSTCELPLLQAFLSVAKSYQHRAIYDSELSYELATKVREETIESLQKNLPGLLHVLESPEFNLTKYRDLIIIAARLRQGDWKIIEDYEPYLTHYLSTV